jgi:hypothetical protein
MIDIMQKINELSKIYISGNYDLCLSELKKIWQNLPEPKNDVQSSYLLVVYGTKLSLILKNYDEAMKWAKMGLDYSNMNINTKGEGEFLVGKVAFERNDLETAKKYFSITYAKSKWRMFEGENPAYKRLLKNNLIIQ